MKQTLDMTLAAGRGAKVHVPWQGSWQAAVRDLVAPVEVMSANLPLLVVEERGGFRAGLLRYGPTEHVSLVRVRHEDGALKASFVGDWDSPPQWIVHECDDYEELIRWIRDQFPLLQKSCGLSFQRMFILDIHDPHENRIQTFDDVSRFISELVEAGLAKGTLYYLPGWYGAFDKSYPDYIPAPAAGGEDGFARLIETARKHGGEIFPHVNHWALSHHVSSRYPQLKSHVLRDAEGKLAEWPGYLWCGVGHPLYYIDPSCDAWIEIMSDRLTRLRKLGLRTVFMDQVGTPMCNRVGKPTQSNENWRPQMVAFGNRIANLHPGLVMGCESFTSDALPHFPLAQFWGPVWTASLEIPHLRPSRLLADAIGSSALLVGHLGTPAPYPCKYAWTNYLDLAERGAAKAFRSAWTLHLAAGVLPTARIVSTFTRENRRFLKIFRDELKGK
jgi:hypothetical protein